MSSQVTYPTLGSLQEKEMGMNIRCKLEKAGDAGDAEKEGDLGDSGGCKVGYYGGDRWGQEVEIFCSYRTHMTHYERIFGGREGQGSKNIKSEVKPF